MIKRILYGIRRRIAEYKVKRSFADSHFAEPEFHNKASSPEFCYRDDNSAYISNFIKHEKTDISPWDADERSDTSRISYVDSGMRLYSKTKKENWMCFFYRDPPKRCSFSFDIEDHVGLDEI